MKELTSPRKLFSRYTLLLATMLPLISCDSDPNPEEEGELITTLTITLIPQNGGDVVSYKFYDADGIGAIQPVYTLSGALAANKVYDAALVLFNESVSPPENIIEEIREEKEDHLFCYTPEGISLSIDNFDKDDNNLNVGITSRWTTGEAGTGKVQIVLRHQPGTKTGDCPGSGDTDIFVEFDVEIVD